MVLYAGTALDRLAGVLRVVFVKRAPTLARQSSEVMNASKQAFLTRSSISQIVMKHKANIILSAYLKTLPRDKPICIGANAGYFFFGTPEEWEGRKAGIDKSYAEQKHRSWVVECGRERQAARTAGREPKLPPEPEHIPFEARKVIDVWELFSETRTAIAVEGKELAPYCNLNDWNDVPEEERAKEWIRSLYKDIDGRIVRVPPYSNAGYERLRTEKIKSLAELYRGAYAQWLHRPTWEHAKLLEEAERYIKGDTFRSLAGDLDPDEVMRMIRKRVEGGD